MTMSEEELRAEIRRLAPFHHKVELAPGVSTHIPELARRPSEATRLPALVNHAFPDLLEACGGSFEGKRVLDIACNCGGFSVEAARHGAKHVLGFDTVARYLEQAELIRRALDLSQVEFRHMAMEDISEDSVGLFDVTFCFGILYHLENPVMAMKRAAAVTTHAMLVDTDVTPDRSEQPLWLMKMPPEGHTQEKGLSTNLWRQHKRTVQFRPNETAAIELLKFLGFSTVKRIEVKATHPERRYHAGKRASFLAIR